MLKQIKRWFVSVVLLIAAPVFGEDLQSLQIHGYGAWEYGRTDENRYLGGSEKGEYHHVDFALNMTARPSDRLHMVAQVAFSQSDEEVKTKIDMVFAEWAFSDRLNFRIGKIPQPFGIYNEIFDVGVLRPFLNLPQGIYGPAGFVSEGFSGAGVRGELDRGGWEIAYDLYGGEVVPEVTDPWTMLEIPPPTTIEEEDPLKDMVGGRLVAATPLDGLSVGLSGYSGTPEVPPGAPRLKRTTIHGMQLEYVDGPWSIRSEYAHRTEANDNSTGAYGEIAYRLTEQWQAAVRYDWMKVKLSSGGLGPFDTLLEHQDLAFAVNYWFTSGFVLKAEYHRVEGNRFAHPEDLADLGSALAGGTIESRTHRFQFGANFSF